MQEKVTMLVSFYADICMNLPDDKEYLGDFISIKKNTQTASDYDCGKRGKNLEKKL